MCQKDDDSVAGVPVSPAGWNGYNNFVEVCTSCQESRKFKTWSRGAAAKKAAASPGPAPAAPTRQVAVAHRQTGAVLQTVDQDTLAGCDLSRAALSCADLHRAAMRETDLRGADLHLADLTGADLRGADLRAVNLRGADLRGADLREARMSRADLNFSLYDSTTQWPAGFDPNGSGAVCEGRRRV